MNNIVEKKTDYKNFIAWVAIVAVTLGVFVCNYTIDVSTPVKAIMWILWSITIVFLGYATELGQTFLEFASESKTELQKVVWPTRPETVQTTTIVVIMVTVTGFFLWMLDSLIIWVIAKIAQLG